MVCAKCQRTLQKTTLATPGVKRKNEMYYGSPAGDKSRSIPAPRSATLGATGIGKSKLLSKAAKNPYAAYSSSCSACKTKVDQGHKYCQRCAYKAGNGALVMCTSLEVEELTIYYSLLGMWEESDANRFREWNRISHFRAEVLRQMKSRRNRNRSKFLLRSSKARAAWNGMVGPRSRSHRPAYTLSKSCEIYPLT